MPSPLKEGILKRKMLNGIEDAGCIFSIVTLTCGDNMLNLHYQG